MHQIQSLSYYTLRVYASSVERSLLIEVWGKNTFYFLISINVFSDIVKYDYVAHYNYL